MNHRVFFIGTLVVATVAVVALTIMPLPAQAQGKGPKNKVTSLSPPCFDNMNRYVNCGNGTVTDTVTRLIWLQAADCLGWAFWAEANQAAADLKDGDCGLTDGSSPGDWRLATRAEWEATVDRATGVIDCKDAFGPSLTNDAGTDCLFSGDGTSFVGVASDLYWSGTTFGFSPSISFAISLVDGNARNTFAKGAITLRVWPVRGGEEMASSYAP